VCVAPTWRTAARALACHVTQAVWYRTLFITFASCAYYNTLTQDQRGLAAGRSPQTGPASRCAAAAEVDPARR
jgi:hypothetical protein